MGGRDDPSATKQALSSGEGVPCLWGVGASSTGTDETGTESHCQFFSIPPETGFSQGKFVCIVASKLPMELNLDSEGIVHVKLTRINHRVCVADSEEDR